jgi:hypothetical protein
VRLKVAELALERLAAAAHLDHEDPARLQAARRLADQPADEVQAVGAAVERQPRLPPELLGQGVHVRRRLVGRVAQDHVVAAAGTEPEEVAP